MFDIARTSCAKGSKRLGPESIHTDQRFPQTGASSNLPRILQLTSPPKFRPAGTNSQTASLGADRNSPRRRKKPPPTVQGEIVSWRWNLAAWLSLSRMFRGPWLWLSLWSETAEN